MALNWDEDDEDLTVADVAKEELTPRPSHLEKGDETVPFARKSSLSPPKRSPSPWEEMTPFPAKPFPLQRLPLHAALPRDRFAAFFIDTALLAYLNLILGRLLKAYLFGETWFAPFAGTWQIPIRVVALFLAAMIYYVLFESIGGATLGKLLCRLRVVDLEGNIPTVANVFLRNICRLFDYPLLFLVALVSMESSHFYQRLGDRAAHTVVIKKTRKRLVPVDLRSVPLSSTFVRMLGFGIDLLFFGLFIGLYGAALNPEKWTSYQILYWLFPILGGGYFMIFEFSTSTTPGKILLQRQVVLENGEPVDATAAILRNLLRPLDVILGYPLLALTPRKQRLGDLIADTLVIKKKPGRNAGLSLVCLLMVYLALGYLAAHNPNRGWFFSQVKTLTGSLSTRPPAKPSPLMPPSTVMGKTQATSPQLAPSAPPTVTTPTQPSITVPTAPAPTPQVPMAPKVQATNSNLKITEFYLSAGPDPAQIRNDGIFHRGDLIFTFFKLAGFQKGSSGNINIVEDVQLEGPNGETFLNKRNVVSYTQTLPAGADLLLFANQLSLPSNAPLGPYRLVLVFKDGLAKGQLAYEKIFVLQ